MQAAFAQTGPGGVGATDGSSNLSIWFDANQRAYSDAGVTLATNGQAVQRWNNLSGYAGIGTFATTTTNFPSYTESALNGYPALTFDGSNDLLDFSYTTASSGSLFAVASGSYSGGTQKWIIRLGGSGATQYRKTLGMTAASTMRARLFNGSAATGISGTITEATPNVLCYNYNYGGAMELFINGNSSGTNTSTISTAAGNSVTARISSNDLWDGEIAEIIHIAGGANAAEQIIIENYLAAKYGLSLSTNDIYDEDDGGYDHNVAGIGRVDASNIHNDSKGTGIVRMLNPTDLDDDEFLFWGHDAGDLIGSEVIDVPIGVAARLSSVWRVSEANSSGSAIDVGSVDIRFDLSAFTSIIAADLRLLIDLNNNGLFADDLAISGATNIGSDVFEFSAVAGLQNNFRFCLGTIDIVDSPLPIVLMRFDAMPTDKNTVILQWTTTSESDNSHFTLERSANGAQFEAIAYIDGAGSTEEIREYQFEDTSPLDDNSFYRLKQTDFNGQFSYSEIRKVKLHSIPFNVTLSPNPVNQGENIKVALANASIQSPLHISIINTKGVIEATQRVFSTSAITNLDLQTSNLSSGIYFVKFTSKAQLTKKVIIR